jgi:hypothetical protein
MAKAAKIVCWCCIVLQLVATGALFRSNPNLALGSTLLMLLPFAFALWALNSEPKRGVTWTAILLNSLLAVVGIILLITTFLGQIAVPWVGLAVGFALVAIGALIIAAVVTRLPGRVTA